MRQVQLAGDLHHAGFYVLRPAHSQVPQLDKQVIGSGLASLWLLCFTRAWVRCRSG